MRKHKQGSTRLKVVQTNTDLELKQKEDNQKIGKTSTILAKIF